MPCHAMPSSFAVLKECRLLFILSHELYFQIVMFHWKIHTFLASKNGFFLYYVILNCCIFVWVNIIKVYHCRYDQFMLQIKYIKIIHFIFCHIFFWELTRAVLFFNTKSPMNLHCIHFYWCCRLHRFQIEMFHQHLFLVNILNQTKASLNLIRFDCTNLFVSSQTHNRFSNKIDSELKRKVSCKSKLSLVFDNDGTLEHSLKMIFCKPFQFMNR